MWLRAIEDFRRVHQDVRAPEICVALVGGDLYEAADNGAFGKSGSRAATLAPATCRKGSEPVGCFPRSRWLAGDYFDLSRSFASISGISKIA